MEYTDNDKCPVEGHDRDLCGREDEGRQMTKFQIWERKLLDFSLRNSLLNLRPGKRLVPLLSFSVARIEDYLHTGQGFSLLPFPADERPEKEVVYDSTCYSYLEERVKFGMATKNFYTYLSAWELKTNLKYIYRTARMSMEENGANNLFLVLGMLKWIDPDRGAQRHYAPLLLLPVELKRINNSIDNYMVRSRGEDVVLNFTLTEMLRQQFNIDLSCLSVLPQDGSGVDVDAILNTVRDLIKEQSGWQVVEEACIGMFSFNKFMMWNDIHTNADKMLDNGVISSLVTGRLTLTDQMCDYIPIDVDNTCRPADVAAPLDYDSSQLEAIIAAGEGHSFILHGPPGTGKSQTITNIIAHALYKGKRVLFVAEKMAALSVVQSRLEKIGLAPFCLELHSNKVSKSHFVKQMEAAMNVSHYRSNPKFKEESEALYDKRQELLRYIDALHIKRLCGLSLYDCISAYMTIPGDCVPGCPPVMRSQENIEKLSDQLTRLDTLFKIIGHPSTSAMRRLDLVDGSTEAEECFRRCCEVDYNDLTARWAAIQRKWFLPRHFATKRFMQEIAPYDLTGSGDVNTIFDNITLVQSATGISFRDWFLWCEQRRSLIDAGYACALRYIEEGGHSGAETAQAMTKAIYAAMARYMIDSDDSLRFFNGALFDDTIARYRELSVQFNELIKEELYQCLAERVPSDTKDFSESDEPSILKRYIKSGGRRIPIRKMIEQLPTLMPRLCPCMLMSPISVAQYLNMENDIFDLVIFDEASQIPTSEAVGAIARGKALICVGDPKQMPPTSFFVSQSVEEDEQQVDDMESILDDCIALSMPSKHLAWHYRSRHESLIAFSNSQYYDNNLFTFPSVDDRVPRVTMRQVRGTYDKGHTRSNRYEAKAIVEEVVRRLNDDNLSRRSIGIVAFSKVQQDLIEDLLCDALSHNHRLESRAFSVPEPIFVKNLENVQGDERDVILFSIGYGPDSNGVVSMNFGPLNNVGGERRLNVAVSRARYEMIVFSTLKADMIDLRRTKALGVAGLKMFLEYAEKGKLSTKTKQTVETDVIVEDIAAELRRRGYDVKTNVGRSKFKIDIAVPHPDDSSRYILGIMCDGMNYYATPTMRDREVVQPAILTALNWKLKRVWALDWRERREETLASILEAIAQVTPKSGDIPVKDAPVEDVSVEENPVEEIQGEEPSVEEAPFENAPEETTEVIKEEFETDEEQPEVPVEEEKITKARPRRKKSTIKHTSGDLSFADIDNALMAALDEQDGQMKDDLKRAAARLLGFQRIFPNFSARLDAGILRLSDRLTIDQELRIFKSPNPPTPEE